MNINLSGKDNKEKNKPIKEKNNKLRNGQSYFKNKNHSTFEKNKNSTTTTLSHKYN